MKLYHNRLMTHVARALTNLFLQGNFDLDLRPTTLKCEFAQDIVIVNNHAKWLQTWSMNKSARAMTQCF